MNITIVLAQLLGIVLTVSGLSMLVNKKVVVSILEDITKSKGLLWLYGFVILIFGATIVSLNNLWSSGLQLFITILGWLALIKGIWILIFPNSALSVYKKWCDSNLVIFGGLVAFILGVLLILF